MRGRHNLGHAQVMLNMRLNLDRPVPLTALVAVVAWAVCILLICVQAFMDMDLGLIGVLCGLVAVVATVRHYFVKTQRS